MDNNKAIYSLKKMSKAAKKNELDYSSSINTMKEIRSYLREQELSSAVKSTQAVIRELTHHNLGKTFDDNVNNILYSLERIKEKQQVMNLRRSKVWGYFVQESKRKNGEVDSLKKYDMIYVPTQGGFHKCVISNVFKNDFVECYPLTTASQKNLKLLGCNFINVSFEGKDLFLTSKRTSIPYFIAIKNYIGKWSDLATADKAFSMFN